MKKAILYLSIVICFIVPVIAQELQPLPPVLEALQPVNVFPKNAKEGYVFVDRNKDTKPSTFSGTQLRDCLKTIEHNSYRSPMHD
jgi:hypothetical protein